MTKSSEAFRVLDFPAIRTAARQAASTVLYGARRPASCCGAVATSSSPRPSVPPSCVMRCC